MLSGKELAEHREALRRRNRGSRQRLREARRAAAVSAPLLDDECGWVAPAPTPESVTGPSAEAY